MSTRMTNLFFLAILIAGLAVVASGDPKAGGPSGDFGIGDCVRVKTVVNVRTGPGAGYPEITDPDYPGEAPVGSVGVVGGGPGSADGYIWWEVEYGGGSYKGWSIENNIEHALTAGRTTGIDVSEYQGSINWSQVASSGHCFAFARASWGYPENPDQSLKDSNFETNMVNGRNAGLYMGAYHFAYPDLNPGLSGAEAEARYFVNVAGAYLTTGYLRPVLDVERGESLGWSTLSEWVEKWMQTVKTLTGVEPIIYTDSDYAGFMDSSLSKYPLWVAHWTNSLGTPPVSGVWNTWDFWQYGGDYGTTGIQGATIPGINAPVCVDVFSGDQTRLTTFLIGGADFAPPTVSAFSVTPASLPVGSAFAISYTVSDSGGSGLNRVELWRAGDIGGAPSGWTEVKRESLSGDGPVSGTFLDAPAAGTYWYGVHVVDNAGNWNDEQNANTEGLPADLGPVKVTVISAVAYSRIWTYYADGSVDAVAVSSDGRYVAASTPRGVSLLDTAGNQLWQRETGHPVVDISMRADGQEIVAAGSEGYFEGGAAYWFNVAGELTGSTPFATGISSVSYSPEGSYLSVTYDNGLGWNDRIALWGENEGEWLWYKDFGRSQTGAVSVSSDAAYLAVGGAGDVYAEAGGVRLYAKSGSLLWEYAIDTGMLGGGKYSISISQDGAYFAAGNRGNTKVYFFGRDQGLLWTFNTGDIEGVCISPEGDYVAAAGKNGAYLFDRNGNVLWSWETSGIEDIALTAQASTIVVGTADGAVHAFGAGIVTGVLAVTPAEAFAASGPRGGAFVPSIKTYTLSNTGGSDISFSVANTKDWVALSKTSGTLTPGGSTTVVVSINT